MHLCYDLEANAMYIGFTTKAEESTADTHTIDRGTMVDVDAQGSVVGIEIINPQREWPINQIKKRFNLSSDQTRLLDALVPSRITIFQGQQKFHFAGMVSIPAVTEDRVIAFGDFIPEDPSEHFERLIEPSR